MLCDLGESLASRIISSAFWSFTWFCLRHFAALCFWHFAWNLELALRFVEGTKSKVVYVARSLSKENWPAWLVRFEVGSHLGPEAVAVKWSKSEHTIIIIAEDGKTVEGCVHGAGSIFRAFAHSSTLALLTSTPPQKQIRYLNDVSHRLLSEKYEARSSNLETTLKADNTKTQLQLAKPEISLRN